MVPERAGGRGPQLGRARREVVVVGRAGRQLRLERAHQIAHHFLVHLAVEEDLVQQIRARRHLSSSPPPPPPLGRARLGRRRFQRGAGRAGGGARGGRGRGARGGGGAAHCAGAAARTAPARAPLASDWLRLALKRRGQWLRAPEAGKQASSWVSVGFSGRGGNGYRARTASSGQVPGWVAAGGCGARPLSAPFQNGCGQGGRAGGGSGAVLPRPGRPVSEEQESWHEGAFGAARGVRRTPRARGSAPLTYGRGYEDGRETNSRRQSSLLEPRCNLSGSSPLLRRPATVSADPALWMKGLTWQMIFFFFFPALKETLSPVHTCNPSSWKMKDKEFNLCYMFI